MFSGARSDHSKPFFSFSFFAALAVLDAHGAGRRSGKFRRESKAADRPSACPTEWAVSSGPDGGAAMRRTEGLAGPGTSGPATSGEDGRSLLHAAGSGRARRGRRRRRLLTRQRLEQPPLVFVLVGLAGFCAFAGQAERWRSRRERPRRTPASAKVAIPRSTYRTSLSAMYGCRA